MPVANIIYFSVEGALQRALSEVAREGVWLFLELLAMCFYPVLGLGRGGPMSPRGTFSTHFTAQLL
jgi:hypothetical protein